MSVLMLLPIFTSGCKSSAIVEPEGTEAYDLISEDLNALHSELKAVERINGKPLEPAIYESLDKVKQAAERRDLKSAQKLYSATIDLVRDDLVDESTIEEFWLALKSIKRRADYDGPCKETWDQVLALVTKERLKRVVISNFKIGPPSTIIDAVEFIKLASRDGHDPFATNQSDSDSGIPALPRIIAHDISLYDALSLVCDEADYEFRLWRGLIIINPVGWVPHYPNMDVEELNRMIRADLDHFNEELKALERIYGKPLDQTIYKTLNESKQAAKKADYENSFNLYLQTRFWVRDHLVNEAALEQYRQALDNIGRRFDEHSICEMVWYELLELRTKKILKEIIIPEVTFRPPATLIDALDFFKQASRDYGDPDLPVDQRGVSLCLKLRDKQDDQEDRADDPFSVDPFVNNGAPEIPVMSARFISLYDALKLVCEITGYKLKLRGGIIMIVPCEENED